MTCSILTKASKENAFVASKETSQGWTWSDTSACVSVSPSDSELHGTRDLVFFIHCSVPSTQNSAWCKADNKYLLNELIYEGRQERGRRRLRKERLQSLGEGAKKLSSRMSWWVSLTNGHRNAIGVLSYFLWLSGFHWGKVLLSPTPGTASCFLQQPSKDFISVCPLQITQRIDAQQSPRASLSPGLNSPHGHSTPQHLRTALNPRTEEWGPGKGLIRLLRSRSWDRVQVQVIWDQGCSQEKLRREGGKQDGAGEEVKQGCGASWYQGSAGCLGELWAIKSTQSVFLQARGPECHWLWAQGAHLPGTGGAVLYPPESKPPEKSLVGDFGSSSSC